MGSSQQFSLRWNNYLKHITCAFDTLRTEEDLVDVTLSCEGKRIRAHKMLLSACSTYFRDLFKENPCQHPVIIFRNVKFDDLAALVDFMYQGEVNVVQEQLASFLTTAELLAVQGLTDGTGKDNDSLVEDDIEIPNEPEIQLQNASSKTTTDKRNKSPSSPMPYHAVDLQPDAPPSKRRKCRENANTNADKAISNALSGKDSENKTSENQSTTGSDPVEIIPLMPNLKLEMPEYLVQDGSSCSYEEQSLGDSSLNKIGIEDTSSNTPDHDQKPDITQTFYSSNQSTSDSLDLKHQTADVGHLLSKPSTSGERLTQEAVQEPKHDTPPIGNHHEHRHEIRLRQRQPRQLQQQEQQLLQQQQRQQQMSHGYKRNKRRSRPIHDPRGRWVCDVCGRTYNRGDSLAHHRSIHRGDTICPICHTIFTRKYTMRCHMLNVHGVK
ncbi:PREDICTED: broad-complex core protein isoforms 1/2/3/4/5-like isoform X2 [Eufriesea mexicana]|uniref:broad-complex core protein isoforms 1/2/3/4/5-like isoform X2 n=1 Tax=Eufriesea mexicana TaxID=516756 RepID=UPI00083BC304|nr:PREDICTED: broad-complex core protein isoforms 1/2/3/4/5-like isoform X2 [Eufriesea mexicana]